MKPIEDFLLDDLCLLVRSFIPDGISCEAAFEAQNVNITLTRNENSVKTSLLLREVGLDVIPNVVSRMVEAIEKAEVRLKEANKEALKLAKKRGITCPYPFSKGTNT